MDPFVGEIRLFPFNYAPTGWALCQGQTLNIRQNPALYVLLGNRYGGDGVSTFGLPNLQGRAVVGAGQGVGLTAYPLGGMAGSESVALDGTTTPLHSHELGASNVPVSASLGTTNAAATGYFAASPDLEQYGAAPGGTLANGLLKGTTTPVGAGAAHENRMPYLAMNYAIALTGIFPERP